MYIFVLEVNILKSDSAVTRESLHFLDRNFQEGTTNHLVHQSDGAANIKDTVLVVAPSSYCWKVLLITLLHELFLILYLGPSN